METSEKMTDVFDENDKSEAMNEPNDRSFLSTELEALNSIYISEIDVNKEDEIFTSVSIDLHPATADNVDQQYVKMTLKLTLSAEYPDDLPRITIRNPRGLSDEKLKSIIEELSLIAEEKKGNSMLFEIIEAAKEHLTSQNRPSGECAICLYGFSEHDVFTRTECYHYFHSHCLARYVKNILENGEESDDKDKPKSSELFCPMCRIPIHFSAIDEQYPSPTAISEEMFNLTDEIVSLQKKMADLYQKQMEKGGIIDVEAEKNRYLLEISNVPSQSTLVENSNSKAMEHSSVDETKNTESDVLQSHQDKSTSKEKNKKWNSNQNYQRNSGRYKGFDSRYDRRSDNYRQNTAAKYQRNRDGQFRNSSSRTASQEHYSKKESVKIDPEDPQSVEENTSEANGSLNKNSDSPDSVKPKYSNHSEGRFNYNRNPRYSQRGQYNRYNNYSNNSADYSYNRDRRYNDSNSYYKFNYRNRRQPQSNDHFEGKFQEDLGKRDVNQRSGGRNFKEKNSNFDHKAQDKNEKTSDSARNFPEKYSSNVNPKKEHSTQKSELSSQRTPQRNVHAGSSENIALDEVDKTESEYLQENRTNPRRIKKYPNSNSSRAYGNDTQYHDQYDYNRSSRYQRNPNKSYNQGRYSSQNGSYKNYDSEKWKNRAYQKKISEDFAQEAVVKEGESQKKERPIIENNVEPSVIQGRGGAEKSSISEMAPVGSPSMLRPPPGFANPASRVHYGLQAANPPPGFSRS